MRSRNHFRVGKAAILGASLVLRFILAARGGQWWWYDEGRFRISMHAVQRFALGDWTVGWRDLFASFDHIGFKLLSLLPAAAVVAGLPIWTAAGFLGAFSVGSLWLIWRLALTATADEAIAFWSLAVAASSASLFYYSRHLFPYDPALFCGLAALSVGMARRTWKGAAAAGVLAGTGFLIYNGYWLFCSVCLAGAVLWRSDRETLLRRVCAGVSGGANVVIL